MDFFYRFNGSFSRHKTIASAWPMIARVADAEKTAWVVTVLTDPQHFWRLCPFPTLGASEPEYQSAGGYWLGSVWSPTNYMTIKGLNACAYDSIADAASELFIDHINTVYKSTGSVWENYSADNAAPGNTSKRDFVGWGGMGPIALLIENAIGISIDAPANTVTWRVHRLARNGIRKLQFGTNEISLICAARANPDDPPVISIEARKPFTLIVKSAGKLSSTTLDAGATTWTADGTSGIATKPLQRGIPFHAPGLQVGTARRASRVGDRNVYSIAGRKLKTDYYGAGVVVIAPATPAPGR